MYEATLMVCERVGVACSRVGAEELERTGFGEGLDMVSKTKEKC